MTTEVEVLLISREAYKDLLELKNHISVKVRQISMKVITGLSFALTGLKEYTVR